MEQRLSKKVMILTGAGQIGMAIARRIGSGIKIVIGDKNIGNAHATARTMNQAGFDTIPLEIRPFRFVGRAMGFERQAVQPDSLAQASEMA